MSGFGSTLTRGEGDNSSSLKVNGTNPPTTKAKFPKVIRRTLSTPSENINNQVRLVWRQDSTADLEESISKVLRIPKRKRSLSPGIITIENSDPVLSEHFDPLSIKRTVSTDSLDKPDSEIGVVADIDRPSRAYERRSKIDSTDMPSVKNLKSVFEEAIAQSKTAKEPSAKKTKRKNSVELPGKENGDTAIKIEPSTHQSVNITESKKSRYSKNAKNPTKKAPLRKSKSYGHVDTKILPLHSTPTKGYSKNDNHIESVMKLRHFFERSVSTPAINISGNQSVITIDDDIILSKMPTVLESKMPTVLEISTPEIDNTESKLSELMKDDSTPKTSIEEVAAIGMSVKRLKEKWETFVDEKKSRMKPVTDFKMLTPSEMSFYIQQNEWRVGKLPRDQERISEHREHNNSREASIKINIDHIANGDTEEDSEGKSSEESYIDRTSVRDITKLFESQNRTANESSRKSMTRSSPALSVASKKNREKYIDESASYTSYSVTQSEQNIATSDSSLLSSDKLNQNEISKSHEDIRITDAVDDAINIKTEFSDVSTPKEPKNRVERTASVRILLSKFERIAKDRKKEENSHKIETTEGTKFIFKRRERLNSETGGYANSKTKVSPEAPETKMSNEMELPTRPIRRHTITLTTGTKTSAVESSVIAPKEQLTRTTQSIEPLIESDDEFMVRTETPCASDSEDEKIDESPVNPKIVRSVSVSSMSEPHGKHRELNEDEIKLFKESFDMSKYNGSIDKGQGRDRSSTVPSITPHSTETKATLGQPKSTKEPAKTRELHHDERKYFTEFFSSNTAASTSKTVKEPLEKVLNAARIEARTNFDAVD